jgi:Zn ribbon nucleic-acid-binding protein
MRAGSFCFLNTGMSYNSWHKGLKPMELVFEVAQDSEEGFSAECLSEDIFTEADNWEGLKVSVKEAVECHFFDSKEKPKSIRLHLVRDEVLTA